MYFGGPTRQMRGRAGMTHRDDSFGCGGWNPAMRKNMEETSLDEDATADLHPRADEANTVLGGVFHLPL